MDFARGTKFTSWPFISVFLQGEHDVSGKDCGTGWNVGEREGGAHDPKTCTWNAKPEECCYKSCMDKGLCQGDEGGARCGWATCADDFEFIDAVITNISARSCVDLSALFLTGESNGGML